MSTDRNSPTPCSSAAGLWGAPAIGSRSTTHRKCRSKPRARRSCACGRRAWPAELTPQPGPIRRRSDHSDNEGRCAPQQCDVPASTSGAPFRESNAQHRITNDSYDSTTSRIGSKIKLRPLCSMLSPQHVRQSCLYRKSRPTGEWLRIGRCCCPMWDFCRLTWWALAVVSR